MRFRFLLSIVENYNIYFSTLLMVFQLNAMIKTYAEKNHLYYLDYFSALDDGNKGMISNYTYDGVHLNLKGYQLIEPMVEEAIQNVLE